MYRAGRPALGARLLAAGRMADTRRPAADIGCDHGKLAVWLALAGCPRVIAVDNRPLPLARARALVAQTATGNVVHCRLGSGLEPLAPGEAGEIVVAGLSGVTMVQLLGGCDWLRAEGIHLVLVPTARHAELRRFLCRAGFAIDDERPVLENNRAYAVISARYTGRAREPEDFFCQVGLVPRQSGEAAERYVLARLANLKKQRRAPMDAAGRARHEKLIDEVERCLQ